MLDASLLPLPYRQEKRLIFIIILLYWTKTSGGFISEFENDLYSKY